MLKKKNATGQSGHCPHLGNTLLQIYTCRALYLNQNEKNKHKSSLNCYAVLHVPELTIIVLQYRHTNWQLI